MTSLNLYGNSIGPEGAIAMFAEALKVNAVLTELRLGVNTIGDEGAKAIAEALKVNAVVTRLSLGNNNMGYAGKQAVQDAVQGRSGFRLHHCSLCEHCEHVWIAVLCSVKLFHNYWKLP